MNSFFSLILLACLAFLPGCATGAGKAPTSLETKLFNIQTNWVPQVITVTNTMTVTNTEIKSVTVTNTLGQIVPTYVTNFVTVPIPLISTVTVTNPVYEYQKGDGGAAIQSTAAVAGNLFAPGVGGGIASGVVGLLLSAWGWLRSSKATATAANTAQVVETARELLKTIPGGAVYDSQLVNWMQQHQAESGVLTNVLTLLEKNVSNSDAQIVAKQIASAVAGLQTPSKVKRMPEETNQTAATAIVDDAAALVLEMNALKALLATSQDNANNQTLQIQSLNDELGKARAELIESRLPMDETAAASLVDSLPDDQLNWAYQLGPILQQLVNHRWQQRGK